MSALALIALGANLGEPGEALRWARARLGGNEPGSGALGCLGRVRAASRLYCTAPVGGPPGQPEYLNAALALDTPHPPQVILSALLALEAEYGRVRAERWGPRTLDLDLLALGETVLNTPALTLPHPRMLARVFVLAPLAEVAPGWRHPLTLQTPAEALARLDRAGITALDAPWT